MESVKPASTLPYPILPLFLIRVLQYISQEFNLPTNLIATKN